MRPIELTIKGINSYSEEQTIDFRELTKEGIFGIFGPTGSGKSTILDGITLALYGELARKSKNFIHVGSDSASVSFTFSITEKETKVYRVFRTFKVKKENGYSVAAKARLCELVTGVEDGEQDAQDETEDVCREVVLEDSISGVKDRIQKIVGLEFDDFTRTVVLPQGKFSEFLKLSGSDRNQMLERLFHLYDYGMALIDKVKRKTEQNDLLYRVCIGKLAEHAGENEEAYQSMRETLLRIKKEQEENQKKQQLFLRDFEKNKALWELQKELDEKLEEYRILEQEKADAKETKLRLEAAERAAIVRPFWEQKKRAQTEFQKTNEHCIRYAGELEQEREKLKELEQSAAAVTEQKSAVENGYQEKLRKLERACELEQQHKEQSKRLETLRIELEKQLKTGESIDRDAQEQEIFLQEQKALLAETERAYYAHMEETVRMHLHEQMEQEGVCPICGNVYHGEKSGEE
ncbi:MAG: AAA family ATPase, partial [Lachnospiraceae bacterium]